jgi:hypothetical protein
MTTINPIGSNVIDHVSANSINYLKPNSFKFLVAKLPNVTYTCQSANLPALGLGVATQPTKFADVPHPGDKLSFGEFTVRFLINEDMSNYRELYDWLVGLGTPESAAQWGRVLTQRNILNQQETTRNLYPGVFSDCTLLILDSNNKPKVSLEFKNAFPISVEGLDFDITTAGMEYFVGIASFRYTQFTINPM